MSTQELKMHEQLNFLAHMLT